MEVIREWIPPLWSRAQHAAEAAPQDDVEYVEIEELVPQNSWTDFYNYLIGHDENEQPPKTPSPKNPSFSKIMASLVPTNHHESSEDEQMR